MAEIPVDFTHLEKMTDDTGLLEHAIGNIPRRAEGYTTDDNARALWVSTEWHHLLRQSSNATDADKTAQLERLIDIYFSFLVWAQQPDGHFHNNYAYDRKKESESPSDDCLGRTLWALAVACIRWSSDRKFVASQLLGRSIGAIDRLRWPRGTAYGLATLSVLHRYAEKIMSENPEAAWLQEGFGETIDRFEQRLIDLYSRHSNGDWHWYEPTMTYSNGIFPWALFRSWQATGHREALETAGASLDFLIDKMTAPQGWIRPIGNHGWCSPGTRSLWDQQPVEVMALALAAEAGVGCMPEKNQYLDVIRKCRSWFYGQNDLHVSLVGIGGGGCDGLQENGVNHNQGAESTLALLMTECIYTRTVLLPGSRMENDPVAV